MTKEELEKEADKYVVTTGNNDCTIDAYIAGAEPREKQIADLEKENTELKEWKEQTIKARGRDYMDWSRMKDQLTKAKEIIKDLLGSENTSCEEEMFFEIRQKAEQFISEVEK